MAETLIKNFTEISKKDTEMAGGKGASLGEMTQVGIPVPEGFVILSNAFDRFLEETDLNVEIDAVLDTVDIKEVHTVENASKKIQAIILSREMPQDIETEILKFYNNLNCKFVAVRSSATSEDSASAAWAGQLDSFLNTTKETLLENVKKCWASLFTPRAIFYRFEKKLNNDKISVAVVVQKMVNSEESGIAFSVHPVTQDENQIIIEAGFGLGEAIVSGSITPDSYVVDKQGFNILDINVNEQTKALYKKVKGGNEWKELGKKGKKQVLNEKKIIELSKLIVKIENHYGFPCDIEWAKEKGKFYIVQSRPITTLGGNVSSKIRDDRKNKKFESLLKTLVLFVARPSSIQRDNFYGSHFSMNKLHSVSNILTMPISATDVEWYFDRKDLNLLLEAESKEFFKKDFLKEYKERDKEYGEKWIKICSSVKKIFSDEDKAKNINLRVIKNFLEYPAKDETYFYFALSVWAFEQKVIPIYESKLKQYFKQDFEQNWELITSQTELNNEQKLRKELIVLKKRYKNELPKAELQKIQKKYRYLGIYSPEEYGFTDKDIFSIYKEIDPDEINAIEEIEKNKDAFKKLIRKINNKEILEIISQINYNVYFRTIRSEKLSYGFALTTPFYDYLADQLNFERKEIGNITKEEILNFLENKTIPPRRKIHPGMLYSKGIGRELSDEEKELFKKEFRKKISVNQFSGQIANKGKVKGKAKIITSINELSKIDVGDILIAQFTRPEYMSAIKKAAALVTNDGGITCHAAIIARELRKPCLIGTKIATKALKDGDVVEVDANEGMVRILKKKK